MIARPHSRTRPIPFAVPNSTDPSPFTRAKGNTLMTVTRRSPVQVRTAATPDEVQAMFWGNGALSVQSSVTGRQYRFQGKGHSLLVDPRDVLMLRRIPDLAVG